MKVELGSPVDGRRDLFFNGELVWRVSEHDLRSIEGTLARDRAGIGGRSCPAVHGEHTCVLDSGHVMIPGHVCSGCQLIWH